jgi:MFS family permease
MSNFLPRHENKIPVILALVIAPLFYVYDFTTRVTISVLTKQLNTAFHINAAHLGLLSAMFFIGYVLLQIPAGILVDRYGSKKILSFSCLVCALATLGFAYTGNYFLACFFRLFIGLSSAFAFIGALRIGANLLDTRHFVVYAAYVQIFGCLGAIFGCTPFAKLVQIYTWRPAMAIVGLIGLLIALTIVLAIPKPTKHNSSEEATAISIKKIKQALTQPQLIAIALFGFCIWTPVTLFASLWGTPFLESMYHLNSLKASSLIILMWAGIAIGGPIIGHISNVLKKRTSPMTALAICGFIISLLTIYHTFSSLYTIGIMLFFLGTICSAQALTYGLVSDIESNRLVATASSLVNTAMVIGGAILQPLTGRIITNYSYSTHISHLHGYQIALAILPICFFTAGLASFFSIKETHCQPQHH